MTYSATSRPASDIDKLVIYRRADDAELLPLSSPTTIIGANATTLNVAVTHGFVFVFDGDEDYSSVYVSACGVIQILTNTTTDANSDLFAANTKILIAPWYDAMKTAETVGYVKTEVQGVAPFRRLVVEWLCYSSSADSASNNDLLRFQCILYELSDKFEFRYAPRVRTGSPTAATASVGFKGDTTGTATNYRDLSVDNRTLGGSNTTSATNLTVTDYDALVAGGAIVMEPNWPMCGRYVPILPQQLSGIQHPYGEPIWAIANNVNWLYARHCPPLVCWSPHTNGAYSLTMRYPIPVTPSADGLTYRVYMITYSSAGGDLAATIDQDDGTADPQPSVDAEWDNLASPTATGTSSGYHDWTSFTVVIPPDTLFLRITLTPAGGSMYLAHVLIVPEALDDIDETATYVSGFVPMAIGQIRQYGAAVHPELYNRAWRNVASIVNDRWQMVWSHGWSDHTDAIISYLAGRTVRVVGVAPASLVGWRGASTQVDLYAYAGTDGATVQLVERSGSGLTWTVDNNGDEYRHQSTELELVSEEPLLVCSAATVDEMHLAFIGVRWVPGWTENEDLFEGVTPAPSLEKLIALVGRIARACTMPYAMTGLATPLERVVGTGNPVHLRWQVPIATKALRPKIVRINNDLTEPATATQIQADSSGGTADDIITIPNAHAQGAEVFPWDAQGGAIVVVSGAEVYDATPPATMDRFLESPTATTLDGPEPERVIVELGAGMCLVPYPADPTGI